MYVSKSILKISHAADFALHFSISPIHVLFDYIKSSGSPPSEKLENFSKRIYFFCNQNKIKYRDISVATAYILVTFAFVKIETKRYVYSRYKNIVSIER